MTANYGNKRTDLEPTDTLRGMLGDMATVYNGGAPVEVSWTDGVASAGTNGRTIMMNTDLSWAGDDLSPAEQFALLADTASHEVEHLRESDLTSKGDFMRANPDATRLAGTVINILEDQYIDRTRVERWPGLAPIHALGTELIFESDERRPPMGDLDSVSHQLIEGLTQLAFAGRVKGFDDADGRVKKFLAWVDPLIEQVRHEDSPTARRDIAQDVFDELFDLMPDHEKARAYIESHIAELIRDMVEQMDNVPTGDVEGGTDGETVEVDGDGDASDGDADPTDADPTDADPTDAESGGDGGEGETDDESDGDGDGSGDGDDASDGDDADAQSGTGGNTDDESDSDADVPDPTTTDDDDPGISDLSERSERDENPDVSRDAIEAARDSFEDKVDDLRQQEDERPPEVDYDSKHRSVESKAASNRDKLSEKGLDARTLRNEFDESGLAADITRVLEEFTTADMRVPATDGYDLNMPAVVDYLAGDTTQEDLFVQMDQFEVGDRVVGVAFDMSGSMGERAEITVEAKLALAAFWYATEEVGDTFVSASFSGTYGTNYIATPDHDFDWPVLDGVVPGGKTPTPRGMMAVAQMMDECPAREKMMVVITDGVSTDGVSRHKVPTPENVGSRAKARAQTRTLTETYRDKGWLVVAVGIGDIDPNHLSDQFGPPAESGDGLGGWVKTDVDDLADVLIDIYRTQMSRNR